MTALAGRHALVTGGGTGIGAAIARRLAADGARVTVLGRRADPLRTIAAEIGAIAITADVTSEASVAAAAAAARNGHGPVDILVNNAGAAASAPVSKLTFQDWRRMIAANLDSVFLMTAAVLSDLREAAHGRVITIASTAGLRGYAYTAAYAAAKHGAVGFTRSLALELARTRVTVNAVCPGFTDTDLLAQSVETIMAKTGLEHDAARGELAAFNPQGRLVSPEEVADAVAWLAGPRAGSITGQSIVVAGGEVQ